MVKGNAGQGMLEYVLILTVILLAILLAAGGVKTAVQNQSMEHAKKQIEFAGGKLKVK